MNDNYKKKLDVEYDECNIQGICSISPALSAIKSAIFAYLQEFAFYLTKIRTFGAQNEAIRDNFIDIFSILITNCEYNEATINTMFLSVQDNLRNVKEHYKTICAENNLYPEFFKTQIKLSKNFTMVDIIKQGQKYAEKLKNKLSEEQKRGYDIILVILKSICLYIIELQSLDVEFEEYYEKLLFSLCSKDYKHITQEKMFNLIKKYSEIDYELVNIVFEARKMRFGNFMEKEVSLSPKCGKAILVAGANIKELELVLEATKGKNINVYTHGQMIAGHAFSKLKKYPHLAGHWGKGLEYYMSDFACFPGAIFLTNLFLFKVETLFSCKIYASNQFVPKNVTKIKDYDFEPLIRSALSADGFTEPQPEKSVKVGLIEKDFIEKINNVAERIKENKIKNVFLIGASNKVNAQIEYFKDFLNLLGEDSFAISFYYTNNQENILFANIDYAFPFLYKALDVLLQTKKSNDFKLNVLCTRCEAHTIPSLVKVKNLKIDNVYFHQCSPLFVNPALVDTLLEWFDIKRYTNPQDDLNDMR